MKYLIITLVLFINFFTSCNNKNENLENKTSNEIVNKPYSQIEGNWELVSNEVNGRIIKPKRTQQLKMFQDGFFSFVMYDSSGKFYFAGAGPYEVDGNIYKETMRYASDTALIGAKDWQKWEMIGDTLIFYGFEKVELADGKNVTKDWAGVKFMEKRVRVKR